jgi:hypothetical protein
MSAKTVFKMGFLSMVAATLGRIETGPPPPTSHGAEMGRPCSSRAAHRSIASA